MFVKLQLVFVKVILIVELLKSGLNLLFKREILSYRNLKTVMNIQKYIQVLYVKYKQLKYCFLANKLLFYDSGNWFAKPVHTVFLEAETIKHIFLKV